MSKRILIWGLKSPAGGVESAVMNYVRHFDATRLICDFVVSTPDFPFEDEVCARGGRVIYLPSRVKHFAAYKKAVARIFTDAHYDAVWCHYSGLSNVDIPRHAKKAGVPLIVAHSHTAQLAWGNPVMKYVVHYLHYTNKRKLGGLFTHFFACSRGSGRFMFGDKFVDVMQVVPNAVSVAEYCPDAAARAAVREEWNLQPEDLVVGHVGRMCYAKNQRFLLEVFGAFAAEHSNAKLLFVGDGEYWDDVTAYAGELGLGDKVIFTGSRRDVPRLLQGMDLFFLPSVTEGFPVTLVEAQATSLPSVVSLGVIPPEVDLTGHMHFVSLESPVEQWTAALASAATDVYADGNAVVAQSPYSVERAAGDLQRFFVGE